MTKVYIQEMCDVLPSRLTEQDKSVYQAFRCFCENRFAAGTKVKVSIVEQWFCRTSEKDHDIVSIRFTLPMRKLLRDFETSAVAFLERNGFSTFVDDHNKITFSRVVSPLEESNERAQSEETSEKAPVQQEQMIDQLAKALQDAFGPGVIVKPVAFKINTENRT